MTRKFNHVGIAVKDMEKAIQYFQTTYGVHTLWRASYPAQRFETVLVGNGALRFELLAALEPGSFIARFIEARGEGIHHMSLEVDHFDEAIGDFRARGLKVTGEVDTEDFKAAFIHPDGNFGVLTELIEPKRGWGL